MQHLSHLVFWNIRAVPLSAKSLQERGGIDVAIGLGLHEIHHSLLIGLFRAEKRKIVGVAGLVLSPDLVKPPSILLSHRKVKSRCFLFLSHPYNAQRHSNCSAYRIAAPGLRVRNNGQLRPEQAQP